MGIVNQDLISQLDLPPGFRFYPTDEELLVKYLCKKVSGHQFSLQIIGEIDLYKFDPWILPSKAIFGEKEWYFFSPRERKYPNGSRPNRVAGSGYWKATGTDKIITNEGRKVGIKKALVFYIGKAPKGTKTNWIMHEYRLLGNSKKNGSSRLDDWVLCRIYKKHSSAEKTISNTSTKENSFNATSSSSSSSQFDEDILDYFPDIDNQVFALPRINSIKNLQEGKLINFQNLDTEKFDWSSLAAMTSSSEESHKIKQCTNNQNQSFNNSVPSLYSEKFGSWIEEEVESGVETELGVDTNSTTYFNTNSFLTLHNESLDSFGIRHNNLSGPGMFGYNM